MLFRQKVALFLGICAFVVLSLAVPYKMVYTKTGRTVAVKYGWLFDPPHFKQYLHAIVEPKIDTGKLYAEWAALGVVTTGMVLLLGKTRQ
jgi:hypothetical protein